MWFNQFLRWIFKVKYLIILVSIILYFKFVRPGLDNVDGIKGLDIVICFMIAGYFIGESEVRAWKLDSPQFVSNPVHLTLGDQPYPFVSDNIDYLLFRGGGWLSVLSRWKGNMGVAVVPANNVIRHHNHFSVNKCYMFEVELDQLPQTAQDRCNELNLSPPYYLAFPMSCGSEVVGKDGKEISVSDIYSMTLAQNKTISELNAVINNKWKHIREFNAQGSTAMQSYQKPSSKILGFGGDK